MQEPKEARERKSIVNHFAPGANCQVFNGNISGCVFAMPGSNVNQHQRAQPAEKITQEEKLALPDVLATDQAMKMWEAAREAGWVDEHFQPLLSRSLSAVLADRIASRLGISNKWKVFGAFWKRNNMRADYNDALNQKQYGKFYEKISRVI